MKKSSVKKEMTIREASDFWDEHDLFEFEDVQEVFDVQFKLKKKKYVGIDSDLYEKINDKAKNLHTTSDRLIQDWLNEKVG